MTTSAFNNVLKLADLISIRDQDAVGDGVVNDTAAITAAQAIQGTKYVPRGTYSTTLTSAQVVGPFKGQGQIKDSSNNKHAPNMVRITAPPASLGNLGSIDTVFNGDVSKIQFPVEHRITGASSAGTPTTGYTFVPETFPHVTFMCNESGWNQSTNSNEGRTGVAAYYTNMEQYGQGDAICYIARAQVYSTKADSTDFLANPAGGLFAGDCYSGITGAYLNPIEINCIDNGYDSAAIGAVFNMLRTNKTGAKKVIWNGIRIQSSGSQPINAGYVLTGLADTGIDFTQSVFTNTGGIKPAILLKTGDCIMGNATAGSGYSNANPGTELITYDPTSGWVLQVGGNPIFQANNARALVAGRFIVHPAGTIRFDVTDASTVVNNAFKHTGSTFGMFGAAPVVQYPGWGTPTGYEIVANFPGGSATLAQCGNAIGSIIAYLKALGMFAA